MHKHAAAALAAAILLTGCRAGSGSVATNGTAPGGAEKGQAPAEVTLEQVGLSESAMDRAADPCQDFYRFACGGWLDTTEIPADRPGWHRGFNVIYERNLEILRGLLEEAASAEDADHAKLGRYYAACMDEAGIEARGLEGAAPLLRDIEAIGDRAGVARAITELHRHRIWAGFDLSPDQDFKDATQVLAFLDQNGLGLPDRDYYLNDDEKSQALRDAYRQHVARMLTLAGRAPAGAEKAAGQILALETELAQVSMTNVQRRDPEALWHPMPRAELDQLAPHFPWDDYLAAHGLSDIERVNVMAPGFMRGFDAALASRPVDVWKSYLTFHALSNLAGKDALPKAFVDEQFRLVQVITGQPSLPDRWKRCVMHTDEGLGELLGKAYVDRAFAGESKPAAERMVQAIRRAFGENLQQLEWMDEATRERAREKLEAMGFKIGYPDVWRTYDFEVGAESHAANVLAAAAFEMQRLMKQVGEPLDPHEWHMTPPTVNAYYSPSRNEMVFPAGILQPPFYSVDAGTAVNLGGIGMVVGHELTHGFDDKGSQFDAKGNLENWWTPASRTQFDTQGQCVVERYAQYEPVPGVHLNGELTLGENIADIGGVKLAHGAYRDLRKGERPVVAGGFTEDQQFFLAFAQSWCAKYREEMMRMLAQVDPHSPPTFRVNGSLPHVPEFAEAFQCAEGTAMNPTDRCEVW